MLRGLAGQSDPSFDVVVADDGSGIETEETVASWRPVLRRAPRSCLAARRRIPSRTRAESRRSAGSRKLPRLRRRRLRFRVATSSPQSAEGRSRDGFWRAPDSSSASDCRSRSCRKEGRSGAGARSGWSLGAVEVSGWRYLTPRDRRRAWRPNLPDFAPHGNAYGFCTGVARADFEAVNGFDTRFVGWGDQDVDLAERLREIRSALRLRGASLGIAPSLASVARARGPTDVVAPPGDHRGRSG